MSLKTITESETLEARLSRGPLPPAEALQVGMQIAAALAAAHRTGLVHGDVRPAHVHLSEDGQAKLVDFGPQRRLEPGPYTSFDEDAGAAPHPGSDIYSFGITLYQMCTGRLPTRSPNPEDTLPLLGLSEYPGLERIIRRCVDFRPEARYFSGIELEADLRALLQQPASPGPRKSVVNADNPWPGLLTFREADRDFFRGREAETEALIRIVRRERLTVLFGISGLGKSSLLQAGLFPVLRAEAIFPVYIRFDCAADHPDYIGEVMLTIRRNAESCEIEAPEPLRGETLWEYFHRNGNDFWNKRNRPVAPLLVFDQFEEVFTLGRNTAARAQATDTMLDQLADLAEGRIPAAVKARIDANPEEAKAFAFAQHGYKLLLSFREDFLAEMEALRKRAPSVALNRFRLQRMSGAAALAVVNQAPHLVDSGVAEQIVRFVAADTRNAPLAELEVEPALLSVVCHELNEKRKAAGEAKISGALLQGSHEQVLAAFYERSVADLSVDVRHFIEDRLLTVSGYRDSVAVDNALKSGMTPEAIGKLVDRRLIRREDRGDVQRLELTHDVLCGVVRASRDKRQVVEAAERHRVQLEEARERENAERDRRDLKRTRRANMVFLFLTLAAFGAAFQAWRVSREARAARLVAERAVVQEANERKYASYERQRAEQALNMIRRSQLIRQAALSNDQRELDKLLGTLSRDTRIQFRARAESLNYRTASGDLVYKMYLYPDPTTLPQGNDGVAFVTYLASHSTFNNTLMTAGPDRNFTATYQGWGCLNRIVALIEYKEPTKQPTVAPFNMCEELGW